MISLKATQNCIRIVSSKIFINSYSKNICKSNQICGFNFAKQFSSKENIIPENRIYYGTLATNIKGVKLFSLFTSLGGVAAQPFIFEMGSKVGGTPMVVFMCTFVGFFTFITPFLLHWVCRKYVTEMYFNSKTDEYTAVTLSFLLRKKQTTFKANDVVVPQIPGMFTSFQIGKQSLFIDPSLFPDPNHYIKIMGYDKPIDFKLELNDKPAPKQK